MLHRSLYVSLLLCAGLAAQQPQPVSEGPFAGLALGYSVGKDTYSGSGTTALSTGRLYYKPAGDPAEVPGEWPFGPSAPDLRSSSIFQGAETKIDVDALSIGFDWILADRTGKLAILAGGWAAINFSVTRGTTGAANPIQLEAGRADGAAADHFSFILPGSQNIDATWVNRTARAQDSPEISLFRTGDKGDIDALDPFVPWLGLPAETLAAADLPPFKGIYFSVTSATVSQVPTTWWPQNVRSGATILFAEWSNGQWKTPRPFLTFSQLGLQQSDDVDAFALDTFYTKNCALFSTTSSTLDPILYADLSGTRVTTAVFRVKDGDPISKRIGLGKGDDVDAICSLDPSRIGTALRHMFGIPVISAVPTGVWASAFRTANGGHEYITSRVVGWPTGADRQPGFAAAYAQWPGQPVPALMYSAPRNVNNPLAGDPITGSVQIPPNTSLTGMEVTIHWVVSDAGMQYVERSNLISFRL